MVVRMRATRAHRDNRRSHHALVASRTTTCECGAPRLRHHACAACGKYRGKQIIDIVAQTERAQARNKRREQKLRALGQDVPQTEEPKAEKKTAKKEKAEKKSE